MNRYSAGHQKLRLGVFVLPVIPFFLLAISTSDTSYQISAAGLAMLFMLGIAIHLALVTVHELGHVIAAVVFRIPLLGFTIGHWRRLFSFRVGKVQVEIRAVPDTGYVLHCPRPENVHLLPLVLFLFGGVMAEAIVVLLVWLPRGPEQIHSLSDAAVQYGRIAALWFAGIHLAGNLFSASGNIGGAKMKTDGAQLLDLWRKRRELPQLRDLTARLVPAQEHVAAKRFEEARTALLEITRDYPDNLLLSEYLAQAHAMCGETAAAEAILRRLLEKYADERLKQAELLDWLICLAIYRGRPDLLPEAERWMDLALQYAPEATTLLGTRGSLAVATGKHEEAIRLLLPLIPRVELNTDRAYMASALAEAYAATGRMAEARRWLDTAVAAEPDNLGVKRATVRMGAAATAE